MTVKTSQKCPCVHIWVNSQNRQLTGFDPYSNFQLKCLNNRRVNDHRLERYWLERKIKDITVSVM